MLNLALATFLVLPQLGTQGAPAPDLDPLFPAPSGPLTLEAGDTEEAPTMQDVVRQYCELTGQNVIASTDCLQLLKQMPINLAKPMTVPADEVQTTFEVLLQQKDFVLKLLKKDGVRLLEIVSLQTHARSNMRASARYIDSDQIDLARLHPAMLFTTVVTLPHTDVRQVSNSMRTMITDANTQQMLPAGNSSSMVLVGFGTAVADLVEALKTIDAASAAEAQNQARTSEVIRLENSTAVELAALLNAAMGINPEEPRGYDPKILPEVRTNSLLITGTVERVAGIKDLIAALDEK